MEIGKPIYFQMIKSSRLGVDCDRSLFSGELFYGLSSRYENLRLESEEGSVQ